MWKLGTIAVAVVAVVGVLQVPTASADGAVYVDADAKIQRVLIWDVNTGSYTEAHRYDGLRVVVWVRNMGPDPLTCASSPCGPDEPFMRVVGAGPDPYGHPMNVTWYSFNCVDNVYFQGGDNNGTGIWSAQYCDYSNIPAGARSFRAVRVVATANPNDGSTTAQLSFCIGESYNGDPNLQNNCATASIPVVP